MNPKTFQMKIRSQLQMLHKMLEGKWTVSKYITLISVSNKSDMLS